MFKLLSKHKKKILFTSLFALSSLTTAQIYAEEADWAWDISDVEVVNASNDNDWDDVLIDSSRKWRRIDGSNIDIWWTDYSSRAEVYLSYGSAGSNYAVVIPYDEDGKILGPGDDGTVVKAKIRMNDDEVNDLDYDEQVQMMTHELGHVLGLLHTEDGFWEDIDSVMDEDDVFDLDGPTSYDKDNLADKY